MCVGECRRIIDLKGGKLFSVAYNIHEKNLTLRLMNTLRFPRHLGVSAGKRRRSGLPIVPQPHGGTIRRGTI